jgi:hypothetical protein
VPQVALNRAAAQCPLWVKSGHSAMSRGCPLYPQKRTLIERVGMSAFVPKADILRCGKDRRYSITSSAMARMPDGPIG